MTTARDVFQASCYAALAKHTEAIAGHMYRPHADNQFVDAILKAWERSLFAEGRAAYGQRGVPAPAPPPAPPARTKASADAARAARRAKISPQAAAARVRDEAGQYARGAAS